MSTREMLIDEMADTIARLTRERDDALALAEGTVEGSRSAGRVWQARLAQMTRERDDARRELHRLTHGKAIEGDGVCRHEIDAQAARAERDEARAERAQLACEVSDLLIEVGRLTASLADERARATEMHRRAQAAEGQLGRVERLRESHAVEVGRLISRRRWDVSLWRGRYQQARRWSRLWHREARRLWRILKRIGWEPGRLWAHLPVTACKACQERDDRVNEYMRALAEHEEHIVSLERELADSWRRAFDNAAMTVQRNAAYYLLEKTRPWVHECARNFGPPEAKALLKQIDGVLGIEEV